MSEKPRYVLKDIVKELAEFRRLNSLQVDWPDEVKPALGRAIAALEEADRLAETMEEISLTPWYNQPPAINMPENDWLRRCLRGMESRARDALTAYRKARGAE